MENENLELILKLPTDKLPFIGIHFNNSYAASSKNKTYANNYRSDLYTLCISPKSDVAIDILLQSSIANGQYREVKCNMQALRRFIQLTHYHPYIHFGHIYSDKGEHKIAKTTNMDNWVLKLAKIVVNEPQGL